MNHRKDYERDDDVFPPADAYTIGKPDVAWRVLGWELAPITTWQCQDCDASGWEREEGGGGLWEKGNAECAHECIWQDADTKRTRNIIAMMIGDDAHHTFDVDDITPLEREAYCGECGQVGCAHDGLDRAEGEDAV